MVLKSTAGIREGLLSAMNFILKLLTLHASKEQSEGNNSVTKMSQIPKTLITCTSKMHTLSDATSFPLPFLQTCFKKEIMTFFVIKKGKKKQKERRPTMKKTKNTKTLHLALTFGILFQNL